METIRPFNKILGIPLLIWTIFNLIIILYGYFSFGRLPIYLIDKDPYSLGFIYWLGYIGFYGFILSIFAIPLWIIFSIILIFQRTKFTSIEITLMVTTLICIICNIFLKYKLPETFAWLMDWLQIIWMDIFEIITGRFIFNFVGACIRWTYGTFWRTIFRKKGFFFGIST